MLSEEKEQTQIWPSQIIHKELGVSIREIIEVMVKQESTVYKCPDYENLVLHIETASGTGTSTHVLKYRRKVCKWFFAVIDQLQINRETAAIAMSYLDRFTASVASTSRFPCNAEFFQLSAISALYLAMKIGDVLVIAIEDLVLLSSGRISKCDLEQMEKALLPSLGWRVHPPTVVSFIRMILRLMPAPNSDSIENVNVADFEIRRSILELSCFYAELSLWDYNLCVWPSRPSIVGMASVLNAMGTIDVACMSYESKRQFTNIILSVSPHLNPDSEILKNTKQRLQELFVESGSSHLFGTNTAINNTELITESRAMFSQSPVCVSKLDQA